MKMQTLQIHVTPGKPWVTNVCDLKHQLLQDLAVPLVWVLSPEPLGFHLLEKPKLQQGKAKARIPPLLCRGIPVAEGFSPPGLMLGCPVKRGRVPEPAAPAALGDAAQLTRIGDEC